MALCLNSFFSLKLWNTHKKIIVVKEKKDVFLSSGRRVKYKVLFSSLNESSPVLPVSLTVQPVVLSLTVQQTDQTLSRWQFHPQRLESDETAAHWIRWFHTAASRWRWSAVQTSRPACRWRGRCRPCRPSPSTEWCWRQPELRGFVWPRPWASPGLQADTRLNPPGPRLCWTWTTRPQSLCSCGPWGCRWRSTSHWLELWSNLEDGNRKQRRLNVVFFLCHEELRLYYSWMETFINYEVI